MNEILSAEKQDIIKAELRKIGRYQVDYQKHCSLATDTLHNISTPTDEVSQAMLIKFLREITPDYGIIAEEGRIYNVASSNRMWCIDPLDGTANYTSELPFWCISLCVLENYVPILAFVYIPYCDDMYHATMNKGAYLNDQKLSVKNKPIDSVLFSFPIERYQVSSVLHRRLYQLGKIANLVGDIRVFNATALELCYIASGRLGGLFVEETAKIWDIAGGMLILEEAGGKITTPQNILLALDNDINRGYSVLAGSQFVHSLALEIVHFSDDNFHLQ